MKFSVALSFLAATALTSNVSGSPIKRDQTNAETLRGAAADCNAAQASQPLTTMVPNAAVAADLVIETVTVTVTGGSGDGSGSVATSSVGEDTAESTDASGDDSGIATAASEGDITANSEAAASGDDSGNATTASEGAIPADSDAATAADTNADSSASQEGSATSVVTEAATDSAAAALPSLSTGSGAQDAVQSSTSAQTAATTEQQQADTQASSSSSSDGGSSSGGDSQTFTGDGTYYSPGLGACGITNTDSDLIAAINAEQYGSSSSGNSNSASVCGKCAQVKGPNGQVKVKITDKCPSCKSGDLDLSPAAFDKIGSEAAGRISISWSFVNC